MAYNIPHGFFALH